MSKIISSRARRDNPYQLEELAARVRRSLAGIAWRWRAELAILALVAAALWRLSILITLTWAGTVMAAAVALLAGVPYSRRFITRRLWCILARHRIHRLCWEARLHTRAGRLPLVIWARPTKVGERLWVWCCAGTSVQDFENNLIPLAAACFARAARVTAHKNWSHLVTIDIIRRDTLAAGELVSSPLRRLAGRCQPGTGPDCGDHRELASPDPGRGEAA